MGLAMGLWVALTPTVGIQMTVAALVGTLLNKVTRHGANRPIAVAMAWISNPVTMVPMYYGYVLIGWKLMGKEEAFPSLAQWKARFALYLGSAKLDWGDKIKGLFLAGMGDVALPMWVGSLLVATAVSVPAYFIALPLFRRAVARRRAAEAARELEGAGQEKGEEGSGPQ